MPTWALILVIILIIALLAPGFFVKGLSFLIPVAVVLLVIYVIVWVVRAIAGRRV